MKRLKSNTDLLKRYGVGVNKEKSSVKTFYFCYFYLIITVRKGKTGGSSYQKSTVIFILRLKKYLKNQLLRRLRNRISNTGNDLFLFQTLVFHDQNLRK